MVQLCSTVPPTERLSSRPCVVNRDDVGLVRHGLLGLDQAVLQHHLGVAEDEVDGAGLPVTQQSRKNCRSSLLVAVEGAPVEHRLVALHAQRHHLVVLGPRRIIHPDVPHEEPVADRLHGGRVLGRQVHLEVLVPRDNGLLANRHVLLVRAGILQDNLPILQALKLSDNVLILDLQEKLPFNKSNQASI